MSQEEIVYIGSQNDDVLVLSPPLVHERNKQRVRSIPDNSIVIIEEDGPAHVRQPLHKRPRRSIGPLADDEVQVVGPSYGP